MKAKLPTSTTGQLCLISTSVLLLDLVPLIRLTKNQRMTVAAHNRNAKTGKPIAKNWYVSVHLGAVGSTDGSNSLIDSRARNGTTHAILTAALRFT